MTPIAARTPGKPSARRWVSLRQGVALATALVGCTLAMFTLTAQADAKTCVPGTIDTAIVGSWEAQVHFFSLPFPNKTESTLMTLTPGGGMIEANGINPSPAGNSGSWKVNSDCSYAARTVLFDWDPATAGIKSVTDVKLRFVLTDRNHFHSTSADATVTNFDPVTGARIGDQIVIPNISQTTAERLTVWEVPQSFPPQP